jgi:CRISPR-associated endonuclease/helicase Cas3
VAVTQAGRWHDLGKQRGVWQRSIGNAAYPGTVLAKSGGTSRLLDLSGYRHELGSLADVSQLPDALALDEKTQDLVLHLIAAHHGRARPHFPEAECFDPERPDESISSIVRDVPRRYGRLQCRYGRWGLAFLESIVRAADILASQQKTDGSSADPADASEEAR